MTDEPAVKEGRTPRRRRGARRVEGPTAGGGAEAFHVSPFARVARTHGLSAAGDGLVAIALADSLFFSIDPNDARWRLSLYLLLTMAPFAIVAPFLGPAMDRVKGGHRFMMIASAASRAVLAITMAFNVQSLLLFPLAFSMLVLGKSHHIAKSAMVPGTVRDHEGLVRANARLSAISAIAAGVAGIPGVILLKLGGAPATLALAMVVFAAGAVIGLRIRPTQVAAAPAGAEEKAELRGSGIILAASTMAYVRGVIGFLTMLLAFELRGGVDPGPTSSGVDIGHRIRAVMGESGIELASGGAPTWHFGLVLLAMGVGGLGGTFASPPLRRVVREERILAGVLGAVAVIGVLSVLIGDLAGAMLIAAVVSLAGTMGKQAFDSIVQRDAPEANLGRSFSRFESRFQLVWVIGALIPVLVPTPARLGFSLIAAASAFAAISYWLGRDPAPTQHVKREHVGAVVSGLRRRKRSPESSTPEHESTPDPAPGPAPDAAGGAFDVEFPLPPRDEGADPTEQYAFPPGPPPTSPPSR